MARYVLYLSDEEGILYTGTGEKIASSSASFEEAHPLFDAHLEHKDSLCLLIDRRQQDIQEEPIPPLFLWDRLRLLFHKKASCSSQGGYAGFQFVKQDGKTYLRGIHILPHDPIAPWIGWVKGRAGTVRFMALESGQFLKKKGASSTRYQMLLSSSPSHQGRHCVFKGKHLLLARASQGEADVKAVLHFLSRTHPDIHDNVDVVNVDVLDLIRFVGSQKKPSFPLAPTPLSAMPWRRQGMGLFLLFIGLWAGMEVYDGVAFKRKITPLVAETAALKQVSQALASRLQGQDVSHLRKALAHYDEVKVDTKGPLEDLDRLSSLLKAHPVHLESISWRQEQHTEMTLIFLIDSPTRKAALTVFESFLQSSHEHFPTHQIQVLEAPFNSSPHEIFMDAHEERLPRAQVKIGGS